VRDYLSTDDVSTTTFPTRCIHSHHLARARTPSNRSIRLCRAKRCLLPVAGLMSLVRAHHAIEARLRAEHRRLDMPLCARPRRRINTVERSSLQSRTQPHGLRVRVRAPEANRLRLLLLRRAVGRR